MNLKKRKDKVFRRGIYMVDFGESIGSEQGGLRPALVIQNDKGNFYSPTTIVCPITTKIKQNEKTHVALTPVESGLPKISVVLCEQVRVVDKMRVLDRVGYLKSEARIDEIEGKIKISLGMDDK